MKLHDDQLVDNDNANNTFDEQMFSMLFKGIVLILMIVMLILLVLRTELRVNYHQT